MANRWGIQRNVENLVIERDTNCIYCGNTFVKGNSARSCKPSWKHIVNDIRINGPENIALCCISCDSSKGSKLLEDWLNSDYCELKGITINSVAEVVKAALSNSTITQKK